MTIGRITSEIKCEGVRTDANAAHFGPQCRNTSPLRVIADSLRSLVGTDPNRLIEIRCLDVRVRDPRAEGGVATNRIWSGTYYADELDILRRDVAAVDGACKGVYVLPNPIRPDHPYAKVADVLRECGVGDRLKRASTTYRDEDIAYRDGFIFDADPIRTIGFEKMMATDAERAAAVDRWGAVWDLLEARGWPRPDVTHTGSGVQPYFRCEHMAWDDDLVPRVLAVIDEKFSDERVNLDRTVSNAARVVRLPGTWNKKGTSTAERPHRRAELVQVGDNRPVARQQMEELIAEFPPKKLPTPARATKGASGAASVFTGSTPLTDDIEAAAARYCRRAERATFGANGSRPLVAAIRCVMTGLDISPADTASVIARHYLPLCGGHPITDDELQRAVNNVARRPPIIPVGCLLPGRKWYHPAAGDEYTADELSLLKATAPDPEPVPECPYQAAADVRELLPSYVCTAGPWHSATRGTVAGAVRVGCHDPRCTACRSQLVARVLATDLDWMIDQTDASRPDGAMQLDAMIIPVASRKAAIHAAQQAGAQFRWVATVAGEDVQAVLDAPYGVVPETTDGSSSPPVHVEPEPPAQEATTPRKPKVSVVFLTLRTADSKPISIKGYDSVTYQPARVIRALGESLATLPPVPRRTTRRTTVWGRSRDRARIPAPLLRARDAIPAWGDTIIRPVGDLVIGAPLVITGAEAASVVADLGWAVPFHTGSERVQAVAVGYRGPSPAHTLMLRLLLTGADYPRDGTRTRPDVEDVRGHALLLAHLMPRAGAGRAVESAIRARLWSPPDPHDARARLGLTMEILEADSRDRADVVPSTMRDVPTARPAPVDDFSTL